MKILKTFTITRFPRKFFWQPLPNKFFELQRLSETAIVMLQFFWKKSHINFAPPLFWGGGIFFWDKIMNFCPFSIKKSLGSILLRPDLPTTYRPKFVCFRPKIDFSISFFCGNFCIFRFFRHVCCSKVAYGTQKWQKFKILFFSNFLNPKDVVSCFWNHFWQI